MTKYICDHCKKEMRVNEKRSIEIKYGCTPAAPVCYYDLCDNCIYELKEWLETKEEDNAEIH